MDEIENNAMVDFGNRNNIKNSSYVSLNKATKMLSVKDITRIIIAEIIGTGMLVFFGCMGCVNWSDGKMTNFQPAISFGLAAMYVIQIFGHISFALLNPAVTIAAVVCKLIDLKVN